MRAWDLSKPLFFAPAMNTYMWQHPITAQQIGTLKTFGYKEIHCISKKLACGDEGTCRQRAIYHVSMTSLSLSQAMDAVYTALSSR